MRVGSGGGRSFRGGGANQFARAPESAGPLWEPKDPYFLTCMKGPEAPSDEKELPKGPPDSTVEDPEPPGLP